jgi:hypothetical protein
MGKVIGRIVKALRLDNEFYARAASDSSLNQEALGLVVTVSAIILVSQVLSWLGSSLSRSDLSQNAMENVIAVSLAWGVATLPTFFVRAWLVYVTGLLFFRSKVTYGGVWRALGYAFTTRCVQILSAVPYMSCLSSIIIMTWGLACDCVAAKNALGIGKGVAFMTVVLSSAIAWIGSLLLVALLAVLGTDVAIFYEWLFDRFGFWEYLH